LPGQSSSVRRSHAAQRALPRRLAHDPAKNSDGTGALPSE
jgi:hypothetical protein